MQYFLYILIIPFLYFNYKIIFSDLKNKIIPNKYLIYLLYLIPFYYIYIFFQFSEINYFLFLLQIFTTFIISFILYYFGIWAAGDAKYLLVLSLFIPYIGIIPFIGNIALITILYLLGYFIYFYLGKIFFNKKYRNNLWINIKEDLNESWIIYKGNKGGKTYKIITKFILIFLTIFVTIRLTRIYLFNNILEGDNSNIIFNIIDKYNIYIIFLLIGIFIGSLYLLKFLVNKFKIYLNKKININLELIGNILIILLFIVLISFIGYELISNHEEIIKLLIRIFTLYLGIYLIIKTLIYSYKITFGIGEIKDINISNLEKNDIIDKMSFNKKVLPHLDGELKNLNIDNFKGKGNIVLNKEKLVKLKKLINLINKVDKEKNRGLSQIYSFNCLKTFPFGLYIFVGFLITYIFNNGIIKYILTNLILIFKNFVY